MISNSNLPLIYFPILLLRHLLHLLHLRPRALLCELLNGFLLREFNWFGLTLDWDRDVFSKRLVCELLHRFPGNGICSFLCGGICGSLGVLSALLLFSEELGISGGFSLSLNLFLGEFLGLLDFSLGSLRLGNLFCSLVLQGLLREGDSFCGALLQCLLSLSNLFGLFLFERLLLFHSLSSFGSLSSDALFLREFLGLYSEFTLLGLFSDLLFLREFLGLHSKLILSSLFSFSCFSLFRLFGFLGFLCLLGFLLFKQLFPHHVQVTRRRVVPIKLYLL